MMDNKIHYDNHLTVYVSQVIMLYTLKLYSAICQLYLNKTERKKTNEIKTIFDYVSIKKKYNTSVWVISFWSCQLSLSYFLPLCKLQVTDGYANFILSDRDLIDFLSHCGRTIFSIYL